MEASLERINPADVMNGSIDDETLRLHLERYHYAGKHLSPGVIADIACGVGYGSFLLAAEYGKSITKILAADIDKEAIQIGRTQYPHEKIEYVVTQAEDFKSALPLNTIISLETIEHLKDPDTFIQNLTSQLVKGGRYIASVPITPSMDANVYHLHDFSIRAFKKLFTKNGFRLIDSFIQVQRYKPAEIMKRKTARTKDLRKNIGAYYITHPGKFFLRIGSYLKDGFTNKYMVAVFEKL